MKSPKFLDSTFETIKKSECFNRSNIEEQMAKMKKMIKSPNNKRKQEGDNCMQTFGVSLDELLNRNSEESDIPQVVERITDYIKLNGTRHEGIFRVNGNKKLMERLKAEFDRAGDADLEESGDIMSVAGLMKMFLRELPEPLIPNHFKTSFMQVHKDYQSDEEECCSRMRKLAEGLPKANRKLLKFLCSFLVMISLNKDANKMGAKSLAIVFAPNIFRSSEGIEGFKEQSITNNIVATLIEEYDSIFKGGNEESPYLSKCIQVQEANHNALSGRPAIPVPYSEHKKMRQRKHKPDHAELISPYAEYRAGDNNELVMIDERKGSQENHIYASVSKSHRDALLNATFDRLPEEEAEPYIRSNSPSWHKPNEEPSSGSEYSPKLGSTSKSRKGIVEKTIKESINEHLFGQNLTSTSEESDKLDSPCEEAPPVPPRSCLLVLDEPRSQKRKKRRGSKSSQETNKTSHDSEANDIVDGSSVSEDDKIDIRQEEQQEGDLTRPVKRSHKGKTMDNNQQLIVQVEDYDEPGRSYVDRQVFINRISKVENVVDLSNMTRPSQVLSCLTLHRAPLPRKRRPPSLHKSLPSKLEFRFQDFDVKPDSMSKSLPRKPPSPPPRPNLSPSNSMSPAVASKIERRKRSIPELAKVVTDYEIDSEGSSCTSEDSPESSIKPMRSDPIAVPIIPPLELYKLAERTEDDPMISPRERYDGCGFDGTMVSPRSRRNTLDILGFSTECPPSPPAMQENHFWLEKKQNTSPKGEATMKELTKRFHSLKKKIKEFEEKFEQDNGRKPTLPQDRLVIKKYTSELGRTRKLIQEMKEKRSPGEIKLSSEGTPQSSTSPKELLLTTFPVTIEQSLETSLNKLKEKREHGGRPENVDEMSRDQLNDEKVAVQRALLQHENTFGRPSTKREKDVMKPLYDRYRTIKRKISSFNLKEPGDSTQPLKSSLNKKDERKQSSETVERPCELGITTLAQDSPFGSPSDFNSRLTQSLPATTKGKCRKLFDGDSSPVSPLTICVDEPDGDTTLLLDDDEPSGTTEDKMDSLTAKDTDAILHQASTQELLDQQTAAVKRKRKLRKKLKTFEDNFTRTTGRKVQKEDRGLHEGDYEEYKKLKARLRLLDALITKHQGNSTI